MRASETYEQSYAGNASTVTSYPIPFQFRDSVDLKVIVRDLDNAESILIQDADYVITRDDVTEMGSFVTTSAIPATSTVKIYRDNQLLQEHDYVNADTFPADSHEAAMDRLTEGLQSVRAMAARSLRISAMSEELEPPAIPENNSVAGIDSSGDITFRDSAELASFLSLPAPILNMPTKTWLNNGERALAVPDFLGQLGSQRDTMATYVSTGLAAGNWVLTTAGGVPDNSLTTAKLVDGILSADATGRAKMANLYVTLAKMNIDFITAMTAKTLLENGDYLAGWSATDNAFRKFAGNVAIPVGSVIQTVAATPYTAHASLPGIIPLDNTVPQITEGDEILSLTITPRFSDSQIRLTYSGYGSTSPASFFTAALFRVPVSNALIAVPCHVGFGTGIGESHIDWIDSPATLLTTTYTIRVGAYNAVTFAMNGYIGSPLFGGVSACTLVAQEIKV